MLDPEIRRVLDGTPLAHLATIGPDGAPHSVPVWIGTRGDQVVFFTGPGSQKARNIDRDPRVAISLLPPGQAFPPVIIRGRVVEWIDGEAGWSIIDAMSTKYSGGPYSRDQERIAAVIEPEHQKMGLG
jgi:PPOX class probable F420-dependent enzyme